MRAKQNALLRRFEGEIDFLIGDPIFIPASLRAYRAAGRAMHQPHADAEIEGLRSEMWRRFRNYLIWTFGFPPLCAVAAALPIATRVVHLQ